MPFFPSASWHFSFQFIAPQSARSTRAAASVMPLTLTASQAEATNGESEQLPTKTTQSCSAKCYGGPAALRGHPKEEDTCLGLPRFSSLRTGGEKFSLFSAPSGHLVVHECGQPCWYSFGHWRLADLPLCNKRHILESRLDRSFADKLNH